MIRNPFINALAATVYIAIVVLVMQYGSRIVSDAEAAGTETIIMPIAFLSLFTLSAAMMGYLFLYQPLQLLMGGEKQKAVKLFLQTVGVFAGITLLAFLVIFSRVL